MKSVSKKKAGRTAADGATVAKYMVTLDEDTVFAARLLGGGNLSLGIRKKFGAATSQDEPHTDDTAGEDTAVSGGGFRKAIWRR